MTPRDVNPVSTDWLKVESAVAAFEESTRRGPAAVRDHCPPAGDPHHLPVLCELLRADLEFAWAAGVPRFVDDYRAEFPALFASLDHLRQVVFEEFRLRQQAGDRPSAVEYARRYGIAVSGWADDPPRTDPMLSLPSVERPATEPVSWGRPFGNTPELPTDPAPADYPVPGGWFIGFKLVKELGRGGFARVYLAHQPDLAGRPVVLKVSDQLSEESQTLARFQHTNIVPIHSAHHVGRFHAVCMPYLGATTLADVMADLRRRPGPPPTSGQEFASTVKQHKDESVNAAAADPPPAVPPVATPLDRLKGMTHTAAVLWLGAELADGLAHAHDRGILHRDLKPANVLIADDGRPMLLDFNLAAAADGRPAESVGGTPMYMAPEQLDALRAHRGPPADPRSDTYAIGLMLYELLTGHCTFVPATAPLPDRLARIRAERAKPFPSARSLNPAVSPTEAAVLARCLHPDPAARYQSAHHLRDDLRAHLDHRPLLHTREPSAWERAKKFARRNPWVKSAAFVGSVAFALLCVASAVLLAVIDQRNTATRTVAVRQFRDELADHRLALVAPGGERQTTAAVDKAKRTLTRFGLPGGDGGTPEVKLPAAPLADEVAELHLLIAAAEASRPTGGRARAAGWLSLLEQADRKKQVDRFRQLLEAKGTPSASDDLSALVVGRYQPRAVIDALNARPPADLQPGHWVAKGECHTALGEFADAAACFTTALALHGRPNAALLAHRGRPLLELKLFDRAVADFDAALALEPDAAHVFLDRGLARLQSGHPKAAVADFDRALELWPEHTRTYFVRAEAKARLKDTSGAEADRKLGLTTEPGDETSWVSRGMAKLSGGDAKGAVADFDAALKLDPRHRDARQNKAGTLADHLGQLAVAVKVLDGLVADEPDFIPARSGRGVYLARQGKRDLAHADAAEVLKRNPPPLFRYQVAGIFALTSATHPKDADAAMKLLADAFHDRGGLEHVDTDPDLTPLRKDARFDAVVAAAKKLNAPLSKP